MPRRRTSTAAFAVLATLCAAPAQSTLVAPPNYAGTDGNTANAFPWNRGPGSMRIQFVHDSATFTQGTSGRIVIDRLRYRPDAGTTAESWSGGNWPNVRIDLSTCPTDHLAISPVFANNRGADVRTVHQGPVAVTPGSCLGPGIAPPFYIDIPLTTPFVYDPAAGDLCVDIQLDGTGWSGTSREADHVSAPQNNPLGSRVFNTGSATATSGTIGNNYVAVCEFGYAPGNVLYPAFAATPTRGPAPLTVQFNDASFSPSPGGVTAWAWDFDNNGIVDSTLPAPSFTYTGCGDFTVSLRVTDATGQRTVTRPAFVRTDEFVVDFVVQALGGNQFQLSGITSLPASAWAWDVDADGTIESTLANPILALGTACSRTIRVTATRNCRTASRTNLALLAPASLATDLSAGTGTVSTTSVGCLFDVQVLAPDGISVCGITTATYAGIGPFTATVHVTDRSYVGKDNTPAAWRLVGSGQGTMNGGSVFAPSLNRIVLDAPFYLPAGDYGLAVHHTVVNDNAYIAYVQASAGPFNDADLVIHPLPATAPGLAQTALFGGPSLAPRQWSGTLHYTRRSWSDLGGHGFFAPGCSGTNGVPGNIAAQPPRIGNQLVVSLTNLPLQFALYWWGVSRTTSPIGPLPIDLGPLGAPGCFVRTTVDATVLVAGSNGTATFAFSIPNNTTLLGIQLFSQAFVLDPATNAMALTTSDAAAFVVGR